MDAEHVEFFKKVDEARERDGLTNEMNEIAALRCEAEEIAVLRDFISDVSTRSSLLYTVTRL